MARKDEILCSFLKHKMLQEKYSLDIADLPSTVFGALSSDKPIIRAIALIVDGLEATPRPTSENDLYKQIYQYLQENTI